MFTVKATGPYTRESVGERERGRERERERGKAAIGDGGGLGVGWGWIWGLMRVYSANIRQNVEVHQCSKLLVARGSHNIVEKTIHTPTKLYTHTNQRRQNDVDYLSRSVIGVINFLTPLPPPS